VLAIESLSLAGSYGLERDLTYDTKLPIARSEYGDKADEVSYEEVMLDSYGGISPMASTVEEPLRIPGIPCFDERGLIMYTRVYIPKPSGKNRPVGVPHPAWRIFLHGLNNFLLYRLDSRIPRWQHGFRPGQGTLTA